jgi:hypothetical protein
MEIYIKKIGFRSTTTTDVLWTAQHGKIITWQSRGRTAMKRQQTIMYLCFE